MIKKDHLGNEIKISFPPKKIISTVPSLTELLAALNLEKEVVGITKFCIHPYEWYRNKRRIGGTKNIKQEIVKQIQPDLIIANKEENTQSDIAALQKQYPVFVTDINTYNDALNTILEIGQITDRVEQSRKIHTAIRQEFDKYPVDFKQRKVAYLIWQNPLITVGSNTFIDDMLKKIGLQNVFHSQTRYPEITYQDIEQQQPDYIFLSSEPYPFKEKHKELFSKMFPHSKCVLTDGEMFSWYGARMLYAPKYFDELYRKIF